MRRLMRFTIGFAAACALGVGLLWQKCLVPLTLYALFAGSLCVVMRRRDPIFRTPALFLLGMGIGFGWLSLYRAVYLSPLEALDGETVHLSVTATDFSEQTDYGYTVDAVAELEGKIYSLRVFQSGDQPLAPGMVLNGDFRLRLTTPAGQKDSSYYRGSGCFVVATQKGEATYSQSGRSSIWFLPARAGRAAREHIQRFFPADAAPFAKALLLGDTSELSYTVDTSLKVSGIRHIVAVSGLHVSALFGAIYFLLRRRRVLSVLVCVPVLLFFAAVTGFSPSVVRASLMAGLMALGSAINEEYDGLTSLSFASLVMLFANPFVISSVSFQLSVASVAGILLLAAPISARIVGLFPKVKVKSAGGRAIRWVAGAVSVCVSATLFSTPLSAYYFGAVSLIGVLANLLIIWMIPPLFCGIAVVGAFGGVVPQLCGPLAWLLSWVIRLILWMARLMSRIPFAAVYTQSGFVIAWLIFAYCLAALFLCRRRHFLRFFLVGIIGLTAAIAASIVVPRVDALRLTALDVGEGQAILLQSSGKNYLIDCGGDSETRAADEIAQTLLSQGLFRLDGLVLTHYDQDHVNAVKNLLTRIKIDRFYLPESGQAELAQRLGAEYPEDIQWIESDSQIALPSGTINLLAPNSTETANENCMCVLFDSKECVILITGDRGRAGERELLQNYTLPDVDVLIAGHHGSKNSTTEELLHAVRPEVVIISAGENNRYGHPARALLERLTAFGCTVYRTDLQGSVLIRR